VRRRENRHAAPGLGVVHGVVTVLPSAVGVVLSAVALGLADRHVQPGRPAAAPPLGRVRVHGDRGPLPGRGPAAARGRLLFNGPIVGMRGDPLPATGARPAPIELHLARFFDAVCSNELGTLRITRADTGEEYDLRKAESTSTSRRSARRRPAVFR
jgi:hypothetical protein